MKISLNWLKKYVNIPVPDEELIRLIGARLVEVEGVIDEMHKYDNIVVARVEIAEKIPDTHLTLCQINAGGPELIQVVCGAPNVHAGMLAAWIKPGAIVPVSVHEDAPFVLGKRRMLDKYDSNGMLAGADELDFGGEHSGIVEIDPAMAKPGDALADIFDLNDLILEIENKSLTHRPDCFGIIGFAREVAGILGQEFNEPEFLTREEVFPEGFLKVSDGKLERVDTDIRIKIENPELCGRYTAAVVKINESTLDDTKYLSLRDTLLAKSGMNRISKIVDVTNYLMLLTGQPLHAFDYDKFLQVGGTDKPNIVVRAARADEKMVLLDGSEIICNENDILITSNDVPVALAGAMGGANTEIDENVKAVLLESASFSLYNLRKTQMAHGIFSEAITRFTKGVPVAETFNVLAEAVKEIGGKPLDLCDNFPSNNLPNVVKITTEEINGLLGTKYDKELIVKTLTNVGFDIKAVDDNLVVTAPAWRTDIHIKEDIIEEVGRLLGYDNIAPTLPLHATADKNPMLELKKEIRGLLSKYGANEVLTYSFVSEKLLEKAGQNPKNSYKIVNSISPELQYVRQSLIPSLLDKTFLNIKLPVDKFALFEMNKIYQKEFGMNEENVPAEKMHLGFVVAERKNVDTAFYKAKKYVDMLLKHFGVAASYVKLDLSDAVSKPFEPKRSAKIVLENGELIGVVGEFKNSVKNDFKMSNYVAGFEIDLGVLLGARLKAKEIDLTKKEVRDLTVKTKRTYGEVAKKISEVISEHGLTANILPGTIYQPDGADEKNMTFRLEFTKFDENIMPILENL